MPRQSRIDVPGVLHHVMIREIKRREIFQDDKDRESFLDRLAFVAKELGISPSAVSKSIGRGQQAVGNEAIEEYLLESQ